ncbi:MAG: AAA family ATPase [Candidatus Lokiarchaeota archaeon]|nr:AAA family ATPase [Candidatus Lokiarchaeota archaeon]
MSQKRASRIIAISGKGGVGKTTISALILKYLTNKQPLPKLLVIDVDADTNMPDILGIKVDRNHTVGGIAQELRDRINKGKLDPLFDKASYLESKTFEIMVEGDKFDLIVMSKSEGEGCYCFINSTITGILDTIQDAYDIIVIDTAAGLEHFSRRTMKDIDDLFIITDPSAMGMRTADRIIELTKEMTLKVKHKYIIGNRFTRESERVLREKFPETRDDVRVLGTLPQNQAIQEVNLAGKPLLAIDDMNETYQALIGILRKVNL